MGNNEKEIIVQTAIDNLEALIDLLHTASTGDFTVETMTLNAVTNMMSDEIIDLRRALTSE